MASIMDIYSDSGYLEIIKGPMFSGKTTRLLDIHTKYSFCGFDTILINYEQDNRYSDVLLSSHDKRMIPCIKTLYLSDIVNFNQSGEKSINHISEHNNMLYISTPFAIVVYNIKKL